MAKINLVKSEKKFNCRKLGKQQVFFNFDHFSDASLQTIPAPLGIGTFRAEIFIYANSEVVNSVLIQRGIR